MSRFGDLVRGNAPKPAAPEPVVEAVVEAVVEPVVEATEPVEVPKEEVQPLEPPAPLKLSSKRSFRSKK